MTTLEDYATLKVPRDLARRIAEIAKQEGLVGYGAWADKARMMLNAAVQEAEY